MSNAASADTQGLRTKARAMLVPRSTDSVPAAAAESGTNGSWTISVVQRDAKPAASASAADREIADAGPVERVRPRSPMSWLLVVVDSL
jgi:hypothetical protein